MKMMKALTSAACIATLAGLAIAQPAVDGSTAGDGYPANADWLQNQPTQFGDNTQTPPCNEDVSDAGNVTTGVEITMPLSIIGSPAQANVVVMYIGDNFDTVSNQLSGGLAAIDSLPLGPPRGLDLGATGVSHVIPAQPVADFVATIDGTIDAGAGAPQFTQGTATSFGDNADATAGFSDGSEIDRIVVSQDSNQLYIHVAGNMGTGFNGRLAVFIDDGNAGTGENQLTDVPNVSFDRFQNMGESAPAAGDGMIFDAGFTCDYALFLIAGGAAPDFFGDWALTDGTGVGGEFTGQGVVGSTSMLSVAALSSGLEVFIDNSNVGGVSALCPPDTGVFNFAGGSELGAVYSCYDAANNDLYLTLTGNLQTNGNRLNLFLDVGDVEVAPATFDPGQNQLRPDNLPIDFGALLRLGEGDVGMPPVLTPGVIFDAGFNADYWMGVKTFSPFLPEYSMNCAVLRQNGPLLNGNGFPFDYGSFDTSIMTASPPDYPLTFDGPTISMQTGFDAEILTNFAPRTTTRNDYIEMPPLPPVPDLIRTALDNSNTGGITDTDVANAANVETGIEICIDMDEVGWDGVSPVRLAGFIASDDNGFLSNQVIGGLPDVPPAANLGEPRGLDFSLITGDQFITIPMVACATSGACSPADVTTQGAGMGDPGFGVPDGIITSADIQFYVNLFVAMDPAADLTTQGAGMGDPGFGVPDGQVTSADIQFYVNLFVQGCP